MYTLLGYKFSIPLYAIIRQIQAYRFFKIYWSKNVAFLWLLDKLPASAFAPIWPDFLNLCNAKVSKYFINRP